MKFTFVALLHNLTITESLGSGDKISESLRITNDKETIEKLLPENCVNMLGQLEVSALLRGSPVVFLQTDDADEMTPQEYLLARLYETQSFLMTTWIFQDNAINCELGFLFYEDDGGVGVTSNYISHLYSTAKGEKSYIQLSRENLREMRRLHREGFRRPDHPFQLPSSQLTSNHPRISRAIFLINAARGQADIAIKISLYCTAFETLFATSQAELAHQLSERLACYLYDSVDDRLLNYRKIKLAYGLRSKMVHGATLKDEKIADAVDISQYCDQLARKVFHRLLINKESQMLFEHNSQNFDEKMLRNIFSGKSANLAR